MSHSISVSRLLKEVDGCLTSWNKNVLGDLEKKNQKLRKELDQCRSGNISSEGGGAALQT